MVLRIECTHAQVLELVDAGYLQAWDDNDRRAVRDAAQLMWNDAFRLRATGRGDASVYGDGYQDGTTED
jgi:hypothetical protein